VKRTLTRLCLALAVLPLSRPLLAQDNYEIQVYGSETVAPHQVMVELHSNYTFSGLAGEAGLAPSQHALHETVEITFGLTPWFEIGTYLFTDLQSGYGFGVVGTHVRPRVRAPAAWHWPVGVSLSQEVGYARQPYTADSWTWEIRPIVDQTRGRFYWSLNPSLDLVLSGPGRARGLTFAPNAKISYDLTHTVTAGLEYYGSVGTVTHFDPRAAQSHAIFPTLDLNFGPEWECNLGVGFGLTPATDPVVGKLILGRRLAW
jgi:hypothetical protein